MTKKALAGTQVLDSGSLVSGPYCSKLLADFGATVIKIERPGSGDEARGRGPFPNDVPHPERSALFLYLNANKLGITLDIETDAGKNILKELVQKTDILVDDHPPQVMKELGLDYDTLSKINPELIMTSITPFGQTGPYRDFKAHHLNTFHAGGEGYTLPLGLGWRLYPDREPLKIGGQVGDYDAGLSAALATLGALYARQAQGRGQHIDVSKQESLLTLNRVELSGYPNEGLIASRSSRVSLGAMLPCKDGFIQVIPLLEHQWQGFVELMGRPEWALDERFREAKFRAEHAEELAERMAEWTKDHTKEEIYHGSQAKGCPAGPVYTAEDLLESDQLRARDFFVEIEHPEAGMLKYPSTSAKLSQTPCGVERPAPLLGQHNEQIYGDRLGYSRAKLRELRSMEII